MARLRTIAGVDPETLNAESADVGEDEQESSARPLADIGSGAAILAPTSQGTAANFSPQQGGKGDRKRFWDVG